LASRDESADGALARRDVAWIAAVKAMTNVSSATPTSFDGAVAMVKFVAYSILYDDNQMRLKMPTSLADNCELLFSGLQRVCEDQDHGPAQTTVGGG
jgi:hypothetical protein